MSSTVFSVLALGLASLARAYDHGSTYYFEEQSLVNHTFYQPFKSRGGTDSLKLPVIIWGNGGCDNLGLPYRGFLGEVASHGALIIATGPAFTDPESFVNTGANPQAMTNAIDWVIENAGTGNYAHVDSSRIAVWGHSCGGLETYAAASHDDRVSHMGIFNSGYLQVNQTVAEVPKITKPVLYILGGPDDVAYPNGERDYSNLNSTVPALKLNHNEGHSAGFDSLNAGSTGIAGTRMLQWLLRGNETAKAWFTDAATGWQAPGSTFTDNVHQNLDKIVVTPIQ
ncbi:hypothetical protein HYFRA_00013070 [Hymenoscyphus fraxineus]|uniref:Uncharacterized protein n=1 Tax=Hymenoscyphus fraxineus TaxID=746836 RepID=A0A9N9PXG3_9HELO|nr:hypothetical protein HYFRA_00013070 [Hymenoscyphus fraxineus]